MTQWQAFRELMTLLLFFGAIYVATLIGHGYGL